MGQPTKVVLLFRLEVPEKQPYQIISNRHYRFFEQMEITCTPVPKNVDGLKSESESEQEGRKIVGTNLE